MPQYRDDEEQEASTTSVLHPGVQSRSVTRVAHDFDLTVSAVRRW
jgi:hypothetical protein